MKRRLRNGTKGGMRKAPAPVSVSQTPWDMGASGPANRVGLEIEDAADIDPETGEARNVNNVKRARRVDMLEVWRKRGTISTRGYNVAVRLRDAFERTQRAPGWPDNDRVQSSPKPDHAIAIQIDRIGAYHRLAALVPEGDRQIIDVCILHGASPANIPRYRGPGHKAGLAHVAAALERLADAIERPFRRRA